MSTNFEENLEKYAEVILKIGLNLQPKQRLLIGGPTSSSDGISFESSPLVRIITKKAYQMGAILVDVIWDDEELRKIRLKYASKNSLRKYPKWKIYARLDISQEGDANLHFISPNPDLLNDVDVGALMNFQLTLHKNLEKVLNLVTQYSLNWSIVSIPTKAWADKMFPALDPKERVQRLWDIIFNICKINENDPVSAWVEHNEKLHRRCQYLDKKQYKALKLYSKDTDLTIGLPKNHVWHGGDVLSQTGVKFTPNIPTEEVFTLPDKNRVEGYVKITRPVFFQGVTIDNCVFKFSKGRIIEATAKTNEEILIKTIDVDEGARRLGEIALVPHSSPISQTGLLFYNILLDENSSNHIALGKGFKLSLKDGENLSDEDFSNAGGNDSLIHLDMMIGSEDMRVDGIKNDKSVEPIMINGEWALEV